MNVCRLNFDGNTANVMLFSCQVKDPVLECFWLVASCLHFDKGLQCYINNILYLNILSKTL